MLRSDRAEWYVSRSGFRAGHFAAAERCHADETPRPGGHTKAASYRSFLAHASELGTAAAVQIAELELANIKAVHAFAKEQGIDCDVSPCDTIDVIYDPQQWTQAQEAVAVMREAMPEAAEAARYTFYSAQEVREKFYCHDGQFEGKPQDICGGVGYFAGSLSAYKFGIGVLKLCLERGLNLQTNTPALEISKSDGEATWGVRTARGSVTAKKVVLATNGYTAHLVPELQGVIVPLRGQITAQRPGKSMPFSGSLPTTYSFIYERGYEYMVPRPIGSRFAGDIVIGGGLVRAPEDGLEEYGTTDDTTVNQIISSYLRETTPRYFGASWGADDPEGRIRKEWTGIMGYSPDGFPLVGEMPGKAGLWLSASFQGHGMVLCWMSARAVVQMMQGHDGDALRVWFPDAFRITKERLAKRFQGRLHTGAESPKPRINDPLA